MSEEAKNTDQEKNTGEEAEEEISEAVRESREKSEAILEKIRETAKTGDEPREFQQNKTILSRDKGMNMWVAILIAVIAVVTVFMIFRKQGNFLMDPDEWGIGGPRSYVYVDFQSQTQADQAAGFSLSAPSSINGYSNKTYAIVEDYISDVMYADDGGQVAVIVHKCKKNDLEKADTNKYRQTNIVDIDGMEVSLKGSDDLVQSMTWSDGGFYYQVLTADNAMMSEENMTSLLSQIH